MLGMHNVNNALSAAAAAYQVGLTAEQIISGFATFTGIKRRLEIRGVINDVTVYDDFAHHPTAIKSTLDGLRARIGDQRLFAVLQFGSNTMMLGEHCAKLPSALNTADQIFMLQPNDAQWQADKIVDALHGKASLFANVENIVDRLSAEVRPGDHVLIMSNKGFDGIHKKLIDQLSK